MPHPADVAPGAGILAEEEAGRDLAEARIVPIRQEQLMERLGERFRELDTPLLVKWPDGRREAILLVVEEETDLPGRANTRLLRVPSQ